MNIQEILRYKLETLYNTESEITLRKMNEVLEPQFPEIIDTFYTELMEVPELVPILSHSLAHRNLKGQLYTWLCDLFRARDASEVEGLIERQKRIGRVHADIKVSLNYFTHGISILKREIYGRLHNMLARQDDFAKAFLILGQMFDMFVSIITEAYLTSELIHETNVLSLKMRRLPQNTAMECERLRSLLLDWLRSSLTILYQASNIDPNALPKLQYSTFGMWVLYKSDLISPSIDVSTELKRHIDVIDQALEVAATSRAEEDERTFFDNMVALNDAVSSASWFISTIVDELMVLDSGMDPLTRLYNRRYLETVLRRHTDIAIKQNIYYSILLMDIDHFKPINDNYGHESGDLALKQFAEEILLAVRASDFVFRYGGDEFLVLLGNSKAADARVIAERIRQHCESRQFQIVGDASIQLTCSIGAASFDGYLDYNRFIQQADEALYQAKSAGGNRVAVRE
jgi:diguanylate cyclase